LETTLVNESADLTGRVAAPLVAIVGPTASGKSSLAVCLAEQLNGEVLACDSTQVYRYFDIGTAKPAHEERRGIPHHLIDLLEPNDVMTAGTYRKRAAETLEELRERGRLPIFTVGTGLYLRALLEGLADAPSRSKDLRARLTERARKRGPEHLHQILEKMDATAAARIAPRDEQKLIRAIEVCILVGKPLTEVHKAGRAPLEGWRAVKIGLNPPRAALRERIKRRTRAMLERGWLGEIEQLEARGIPATARPFGFIGYRELQAHRVGKITLEEAEAAIEKATRRYAKRQMTWFRKEQVVEWFTGFGDDPATANAALAHLRKELSGARSRVAGE
jgi:tRNA dimethylallyltransferase